MKTLRLVFYIIVLLAWPALSQVPFDLPTDPGLYCMTERSYVRLEAQAVSFSRTGGLLTSAVTAGIKSSKVNVQVLGRRASHTVDSLPVFYFRESNTNVAGGGSAADLVLVRMKVKGKRRQFEVAARGAWRASKGISIRSQIQIARQEVGRGIYRIAPVRDLDDGQYGFYLFRGEELPGLIYDFGVGDE